MERLNKIIPFSKIRYTIVEIEDNGCHWRLSTVWETIKLMFWAPYRKLKRHYKWKKAGESPKSTEKPTFKGVPIPYDNSLPEGFR